MSIERYRALNHVEDMLNAALAIYERSFATGNLIRAARWARIADRYFVACYGPYR